MVTETEYIVVPKKLLQDLEHRIGVLETSKTSALTPPQPFQANYNLIDACRLKGIAYKTLTNRAYRHLQPNNGTPDLTLNCRSYWRRDTIFAWLGQSDKDLERMVAVKARNTKSSANRS